jgi:hypothetical protein
MNFSVSDENLEKFQELRLEQEFPVSDEFFAI